MTTIILSMISILHINITINNNNNNDNKLYTNKKHAQGHPGHGGLGLRRGRRGTHSSS